MGRAKARIFRLSEGDGEGRTYRFLSDRVDARQLAEGRRTVALTVTRTGQFYDPRYGHFEITRGMLQSMVKNFEAGVYGQEIALDVAHRPQEGAAGYFRQLFLEGNKLRAKVELTEYGIEAIQKRGMKYVSAEFSENYIPNESPRDPKGPTLLGAGLTPRPVIKRLDPIQLSEDALEGAPPTFVSDRITRILHEETETMWEKLKKRLAEKLGSLKLAEEAIKKLCAQFEETGKELAIEDEGQAEKLLASFEEAGKQLAEAMAEGGDAANINLSVAAPEGGSTKALSEEDVNALLDRREKERQERDRKLAEDREALLAKFREHIDGHEGLKSLSEDQRKELTEFEELITPETTEEQVGKLAQRAIALGEQLAVSKQLAGIGYEIPGDARITVDESNKVKELQEAVDRRLGLAEMPESRRFSTTGGQLSDVNKRLAEKVLGQFDAEHAAQLHAEHKMLSGGDGVVADADVPASWERTVIREALYRLTGTQFVDAGTAEFNTSMFIPYSYRDTTGAGRGDTRVYEGGSIPRAGVIQTSETAYPIPQKLAFEVSDELRQLTAARHLNWDAVAENQRNATRIISEDLEQLIFNEVLRASDEYSAVTVSNEVLDPGDDSVIDGSNNVFPLTNFPVVRPRAVYDLQGNQIGSTSNPVTVEYDDGGGYSAIDEYDGTGTQSAGMYYVLDYNHGEIKLVDESGALQTPANTTNIRVSYSYTGNAAAFDTDEGSTELATHWDSFLYRYGLRKSVLEDDRFHAANFGLMSGSVMNQIEQARKFVANWKTPGTSLADDGNLGRIKDVPNFKTSAPGLHMGDQRIVIGERGISRMRMMKPWTMGELENQRDSNGRYTGKKEAYGNQYLVLHTPSQLKRAYTSIVLYSGTGRVARAE